MMKRTKHYTFRDYFKRPLSHHVRLSKRSIKSINGFGYAYKVNEEQLINQFKSCTINVNKSTYSIYSPEYIAKEKYKYV